jgi:hypothetical protein
MSPDGNKDPVILIRPDPYDKYEYVSWTNDGKRIIYRYTRADQPYQDLNGTFTCMMDADGTNYVELGKGQNFVLPP